jgi:NADH-quinone oxidoreductase subunit L
MTEIMNGSLHLWLIPVLPLAGFLINGLLGKRLPKFLVTAVALLAPLAAFAVVLIAAASTFFPQGFVRAMQGYDICCPDRAPSWTETFGTWINIGALHIDFAFVLDQLSLVMLLVVTGVGFLIHIYSVGYMKEDPGYARYFAYLNLFLFFMTTLVLAGNALVMFIGWEGVGLASYLLIGFWFSKASAARPAKKLSSLTASATSASSSACFCCWPTSAHSPSPRSQPNSASHPGWTGGVVTVIALCLLLGATGKSAQLPLYIWLPDAMEGPTPVSALIHAATMVTAGVYMIARTHVLFDHSPFALSTVAIVGAATALFAATIALVQTDIKRVLAYSTISQLGYMFLGCGVAAYSAAIFHLMTHAFFKALLFLAAGSVIHGLGGEQDMRKMGGLRKKMPVTFWTMTAAVIAIAGIPPLRWLLLQRRNPLRSLPARLARQGPLVRRPHHRRAHRLLHVPPLVPHLYFGETRSPDAHPHESPWSMLGPLVILALLSIGGGWIGIDRRFGAFSPRCNGPRATESGGGNPSKSF